MHALARRPCPPMTTTASPNHDKTLLGQALHRTRLLRCQKVLTAHWVRDMWIQGYLGTMSECNVVRRPRAHSCQERGR